MRTFIAIELPPNVAQQLETNIRALQHYLREHNAPSCFRWVDPSKIHLTLRFLGETTPAQVQPLATGLREVAHAQRSFALTIGGIGGFPNLRQPRVLWLGVGGDVSQLNALQAAVEARVQLAGFVPEDGLFSAHITVARVQRNVPRQQLNDVGQLLKEAPIAKPLRLPVTAVVHLQSELRTGGAVYTRMEQFLLAPEPY